MAEARRTLVKSPPELWALISDPDCLAKHLEAFGEIRITRVEPETTVAWEGDRARGTVELEASGWGTKVRLTAEPVEVEEPALQQPLAPPVEAPPVREEPEPEPEPEPIAEEEREPVVEEEPEPVAEEEPERPAKRPRLFARLFGRRGELRVTTVPPDVVAEEPEVVEEPAPAPAPPVAEEPVAEAPEVVEEPVPVEEPEAAGEIRVSRLGDDEAADVLNGVLDTLGAAHHRPFSRS